MLEPVNDTVNEVSGSISGNLNSGVQPGARGVVDPDTSDNLAYGVTRSVDTTQNPSYEGIHLK